MYSRFVDNGKLAVLTSARRENGFPPKCKTSTGNELDFRSPSPSQKSALLKVPITPSAEGDHDYCQPPSSSVDKEPAATRNFDLPDPSVIPAQQGNLPATSILYYPVQQRSVQWYHLRTSGITASVIGDLLSIGGTSKFEESWAVLQGKQVEKKKNFLDFQRELNTRTRHESFLLSSLVGVLFRNILPSSVRISMRVRSVGFCCSKFSLAKWLKHHSTSLAIAGHEPPLDITV